MAYVFKRADNATYKIVDGVIQGNLADGDPQLSTHFWAHEFACPCCKDYKIAVKVLEGLENVRGRLGKPIYIAHTSLWSNVNTGGSGYRCQLQNKLVGGVANSQHLYGKAVDVHPTGGVSVSALYVQMAIEPVFERGGLGRYSTFVHGDCGRRRRW